MIKSRAFYLIYYISYKETSHCDAGFNMLRASVSKEPLPSARRVSVMTMKQGDAVSKDFNNLFVVFGQFIDHDLTQAPIHVKGSTSF